MHHTGLDLNSVLTHTENLSFSEQYMVTLAYQELIHNSLRYVKFRMSGKYTSTMQDLEIITRQSSKGDWSRQAPVIGEKDKHACSL